eukprot:Rmarinus@m.25417
MPNLYSNPSPPQRNSCPESVIVRTAESIGLSYLTYLLLSESNRPVILAGPPGTCKTRILRDLAVFVDPARFKDGTIGVNWLQIAKHTTSYQLQSAIESQLLKRKRYELGPPIGQKVYLFIDDLSLPSDGQSLWNAFRSTSNLSIVPGLDTGGSSSGRPLSAVRVSSARGGRSATRNAMEEYTSDVCPPHELLRQALERGGWYAAQGCNFVRFTDVTFVAAMSLQPYSSRAPSCCGRFLRHFSIIAAAPLSSETLKTVFSRSLEWCLSGEDYGEPVLQLVRIAAEASLDVYNKFRMGSAKVTGTEVESTLIRSVVPQPSATPHILTELAARIANAMRLFPSRQDTFSCMSLFVKAWAFNARRLFCDAVSSETASNTVHQFVREVVEARLVTRLDAIKPGLFKDESLRLFTYDDFMGNAVRECSFDELKVELAKLQEDYNSHAAEQGNSPMNLVFFDYSIRQYSYLREALVQRSGHVLAVESGGSGARSLSRLAVFASVFTLREITVRPGFRLSEWREEIKMLLLKSGQENLRQVLLIDESQLSSMCSVAPHALDDLHKIITGTTLCGFFTSEEMQAMAGAIRRKLVGDPLIGEAALLMPMEQILRFFSQRCQENLRIIMVVREESKLLKQMLQAYPSISNKMTWIRFPRWPRRALGAVAASLLRGFPDKRISQLAYCSAMMHESVCGISPEAAVQGGLDVSVTPPYFIDLIKTFLRLSKFKKEEIDRKLERFDGGLRSVRNAECSISEMRIELEALGPQLERAEKETDQLMVSLQQQRDSAEETRESVMAEEVNAAAEAEVAQGIRDECEADVGNALPALESAMKALKKLKKSDVSEVKSMKRPPEGIKLVLEAVCVMKNLKPGDNGDYWSVAKRMLSDTKFIHSLMDFDRDNIPDGVILAVEKYIQHPSFRPEVIAKVSRAASGLCSWVLAMNQYHEVAKVVKPKRETLAAAEENLAEIRGKLEQNRRNLRDIEERMSMLSLQFKATQEKKQQILSQYESCQRKVHRASALLSTLAGEKTRWEAQRQQLVLAASTVEGDCLLAAGWVTYFGPFPLAIRTKCMETLWTRAFQSQMLEFSRDFTLSAMLSNPVQIRAWNESGLPRDRVSVDNAVIMANNLRWPLLIDPQKQANLWIKKMEQPVLHPTPQQQASGVSQLTAVTTADGTIPAIIGKVLNNTDPKESMSESTRARRGALSVLKTTDAGFLKGLENAIQFGSPVLLENVGEDIDPIVRPLIFKQLTHAADGSIYVRLGEDCRVLTVAPSFRLYMTTMLSHPRFPPDICSKVSLVDFTITPTALEDQILSILIANERPDLEKERVELIEHSAADREELVQIQDHILELLSGTENLLDDEEVIQTLQQSQVSSDEISKRLALTQSMERGLDEARAAFQPAAKRTCTLFFCLRSLASLNPLYQFSVSWFTNLFEKTVKASRSGLEPQEGEVHLRRRLEVIREQFTLATFEHGCRSLYAKDRLMFTFLLALHVLREKQAARKKMASQFLNIKAKPGGSVISNVASAWKSSAQSKKIDRESTEQAESASTQGLASGLVSPSEWRFFLTGANPVTPPPPIAKNPLSDWLPDKAWENVNILSQLAPEYLGLADHLMMNRPVWNAYYVHPHFSSIDPPQPYGKRLSPVQKLILVKCLNPQHLLEAVRELIRSAMGEPYSRFPTFDVGPSFDLSNSTTPILFILSPGADPMSDLQSFSAQKGMENGVREVGLGQGQGKVALRHIHNAARFGTWAMVQNIHVAPNWMRDLETLCADLASGAIKTADHFRLFLTALPSPHLPMTLLQGSIKVVVENPPGLKANMLRMLDGHEAHTAAAGRKGLPQPFERKWVTLVYTLCFFHAVVQVRRRFGSIGWSAPYMFTDSDFKLSIHQARIALNDAVEKLKETKMEGLSWPEKNALIDSQLQMPGLMYMVGVCNYGGRVTNEYDHRCLLSLLRDAFAISAGVAPSQLAYSEDGTIAIVDFAPGQDELDEMSTISDLRNFMEKLPTSASPEVIGLHANATMHQVSKESDQFISTLVETDPASLKVKSDVALQSPGSVDGGLPRDENRLSRPSGIFAYPNQVDQACNNGTEPLSTETRARTQQPRLTMASQNGVALQKETVRHVACDIIEKLESIELDFEYAVGRFPVDYAKPLNSVLLQEVAHLTMTVGHVLDSLNDLLIHIDIAPLPPTSADIFQSLLDGAVPHTWAEIARAPVLPLGQWIRLLIRRLCFLEHWVRQIQISSCAFSLLAYPAAFLTATLLQFSRNGNLNPESVAFQYVVVDEKELLPDGTRNSAPVSASVPNQTSQDYNEEEGNERLRILLEDAYVAPKIPAPSEGIYVEGLFLEGARWNRESSVGLAELLPMETFVPMPLVWFRPQPIGNQLHVAAADSSNPVEHQKSHLQMVSLSSLARNASYTPSALRVIPEKSLAKQTVARMLGSANRGPDPRKELASLLPPPSDGADADYECPVYFTADRAFIPEKAAGSTLNGQNTSPFALGSIGQICSVMLPTGAYPPSHWSKRGVCLIVYLKD